MTLLTITDTPGVGRTVSLTDVQELGMDYATRADLLANTSTVPSGATVTAAGRSYRKNDGLDIPDLPNFTPAHDVTPEHFGAVGDGVTDDTAAVNAASLFAFTSRRELVCENDYYCLGTVWLAGGKSRWIGKIITGSTSDYAVRILDQGGYVRNMVANGLTILGNATAFGGMQLDHILYSNFPNLTITDFTKAGAWGLVLTSTADNRNTSSNTFSNTNIARCDNLLKVTRDGGIPGSANTGASFNTFTGGYLGPFGSDTDTVQYGVLGEVGEGNKFFNVRVSTSHEYTRCWEINDARWQMVGCAGDGPVFSAFVYLLAGNTGTVSSITLTGVSMMTTPVAWAGTAAATATAIVAQIVADGKQYPNTAFRAIAHGPQVIFYRVDANDDEVRLTTAETKLIVVNKTGDLVAGDSSVNNGLLQGAPYASYGLVTKNKWGYPTGHGGNREAYGFYMKAGGSGSLYEPEGNGQLNLLWFENEFPVQAAFNVIQAGLSVHGGASIATDMRFDNQDANIAMIPSTVGDIATVYNTRLFRTAAVGPMVFVSMKFSITHTFTTASGQFYFELSQFGDPRWATTPIDVSGMLFFIPVAVTGFKSSVLNRAAFMRFSAGTAVSPINGKPYAQLVFADSNNALTVAGPTHVTTGVPITIDGSGSYPVNRFI